MSSGRSVQPDVYTVGETNNVAGSIRATSQLTANVRCCQGCSSRPPGKVATADVQPTVDTVDSTPSVLIRAKWGEKAICGYTSTYVSKAEPTAPPEPATTR